MSRPTASLLALVMMGCTPTTTPDDTGGVDAGTASDTGGPAMTWTESAPLPSELAHAAAILLTSEGNRWIYVVGGATVADGAVTSTSSRVLRAAVSTDGSLGAWEDIAAVGRESPALPVSQHGILRLTGEDLRQGLCIAGGTAGSDALPFVLATYVEPDGSLDSPWGAFPPRIATGEGQWQAAFMPFDPHALALVGGIDASGFTARVQYAQIYLAVDVPTFTAGPALPAPRAAHSWVRRDRAGMNPDLYVIGGHNADGATDDILRTTRDDMDAVDGWEVVGTLPSAPYGHASVVIDDMLYVMGGVEGTTITDRVRRAPITTDGTIGAFEDVADAALSVPLANAAVVQDDVVVYLIGGRTGADGASSTHVLIGRL
jgi:hypothetical protein